MKNEKINVSGMISEYSELNIQIETFLQLQQKNRVSPSYTKLVVLKFLHLYEQMDNSKLLLKELKKLVKNWI